MDWKEAEMGQSQLGSCGCNPGRKHREPLTMEVQGGGEGGRVKDSL